MAMGSLSSLGLGSGVLNSDIIDKLKKADENAMIKPIDTKMKENIERQKELITIKEMLSTMQNSTKKLADYSTYIARETTVSGDCITASARAGVPVQDIRVQVRQMAKNDINEIGTHYLDKDEFFSPKDANLDFYHKGKNYNIKISTTDTLSDVAQKITDTTNGAVIGVIMRTGGAKPYQLLINSRDTGEENRIYFGNTFVSKDFKDGENAGIKNFDLNILSKGGAKIPLKVSVDLNNINSAQDKAVAAKKAIIAAIIADKDLEPLYTNGDINIGIASDNKSILINDKRGYDLGFGGDNSSELGFSNADPLLKNLIETKPLSAGLLQGKITFGTVPIDLATITKKTNSSEQNAKALAETINNIAGMYAKTSGNGRLIVNSETGEVNIEMGNDPASLEFAKSVSMPTGVVQSYSTTQNKLFKLKNIQKAQDALITYNGVDIYRSKNTIDDIISGLTINLQKVSTENETDIIHIKDDQKTIIEQVKEFVKSYNELGPKLDSATRYDPESKVVGIFNGVSFIRNIRPSLNQILSYTMGAGLNMQSLMNYGISLNEKSKISLDEGKLAETIAKDPKKTQNFFYGENKKAFGRDQHIKGVFEKFTNVLDGLVKGSKGSLNLYEDELERTARNLQKDKNSSMKLLDDRYNIMANRFAAYDEQIAKANAGFNSVQMMIDQSISKKK